MKKATKFLMGLGVSMILISGSLLAQPTLDGTFDGTGTWGTAVATNGSAGWASAHAENLYISSDATYIYFGAEVTASDWQSWGFLINTTTGGGSSEPYGAQITFAHSDLPDYVIRGGFTANGFDDQLVEWNGSGWTYNGGFSSSEYGVSESFVEVRIARSSLGNPDSVDVQFYISGNTVAEHGTFSSVPADEEADSWDESGAPNTLDNYQSEIDVELAIKTTTSAGDWSSTSTWSSGAVPESGDAVQIDHAVTLDQDATVSQFTVSSGITFTASDGSTRTLSIQDAGSITVDGTFTASDGEVDFLGAGSVSGSPTFNNIGIAGGVNIGSGSTIDGTLTINSGGYLASSSGGSGLGTSTDLPNFGSSSTLRFEGTFSFGTSGDNYAGGFGTTTNKIPTNLEIGSSGALTIAGDARTLSGTLEIESGGSLTTNGLLTLSSDARLLNSGTITGDITFERSVTGDAGWRLLSFPITGGTAEDVSDDSPVQGITGGDNTSFDANFNIYDDSGAWGEPTDVSTAFGDGLGFAMYFYDNTDAGSSELPVTLGATGSEPSSDVSVSLNDGAANLFTLVGNPFASNFNTNSITTDLGSIQDNVSFWDDAAGAPTGGDAGSTTGSYVTGDRTTDYIVAPWQGFWVETSDVNVTTIGLPTSGKTSSDTSGTHFSKVVTNRGDINFILTSESSYDAAIRLAIRDYATTGFDRADATKLIPLIPEYATMAFKGESNLKSVESLPWNLDKEISLPMELSQVNVNGTFTLTWEGIESIPSDWKVELNDYETGKSFDLRETDSIIFESFVEDADVNPVTILRAPKAEVMKSKSVAERFTITITPNFSIVDIEENSSPEEFTLSQNYPNPFNPSTNIRYSVAEAGDVTLSVFNLMGQKVAELVNENKAAGTYSVSWNASGMASGMYYYRLASAGQTLTRKMTLIK